MLDQTQWMCVRTSCSIVPVDLLRACDESCTATYTFRQVFVHSDRQLLQGNTNYLCGMSIMLRCLKINVFVCATARCGIGQREEKKHSSHFVPTRTCSTHPRLKASPEGEDKLRLLHILTLRCVLVGHREQAGRGASQRCQCLKQGSWINTQS